MPKLFFLQNKKKIDVVLKKLVSFLPYYKLEEFS